MPVSASALAACRAMHEAGAGSVLVTADDGRLAGIFIGEDAVARVLVAGRSARNTRLGEVMTGEAKTLGSTRTGIEALRLMAE